MDGIVWGGVRNGGARPEEASRQLYGAGGELGGDKLAGRFPVQSPYRRLLITPAKEDKEEQPHLTCALCVSVSVCVCRGICDFLFQLHQIVWCLPVAGAGDPAKWLPSR